MSAAVDNSKQLVVLSTGIIALTITFSQSFLGGVKGLPRTLLLVAWVVFLVSVICGVWTQLALTGELAPKVASSAPPSIRGANVVIPATTQILTFLAAVALTIAAGALAS